MEQLPKRGISGRDREQKLESCQDCGEARKLTDDGLCMWCCGSDNAAKRQIRNALDELEAEYHLAELFWSLDEVYDEYDEKMQEFER